MCGDSGIVQDTEVVGKVKCSNHRLVRAKIALNLKRTRTRLITKKQANLDVVRVKAEEVRIVLEDKYGASEQEETNDTEGMNETVITRLISEAAIEVGGKAPTQDVSKASETTRLNKKTADEADYHKR